MMRARVRVRVRLRAGGKVRGIHVQRIRHRLSWHKPF